jgi:DNA-binding transcriptional LysR family regulator
MPSARSTMPASVLDFTVLRYFQTVADLGNMTSAARLLRVSQPALSVAMSRLEAKLETTLFVRHKNGVSLTSAGIQLSTHAEEIFASVARAEHAVRELEVERIGRFIVGCPDVLGAYFLPPLMKHLLSEAPKVEVALWNGTSREVERAVLDRKVHFGLVARFLPHADLVHVSLFADTTALLVLGRPAKTFQEARERLRGGPLCYVDGLPQEDEILRQLAARNLLPEQRIPCATSEMVKAMGLAGVGIAILPERVAAYGQEGKLRRLHPSLPAVVDRIGLIYRGDWHRTRAATWLKEALIAHSKAFV